MTWNKGLSLLLQSWSVNATRNNDSRSPEAIATHRAQEALLYFVTQISWGQWYVTSVALNTPYFIRSTQATRVNTYLCTYPCIALLDTTYIHKDKTLLTLLSSSSFFSHPQHTDFSFFIHLFFLLPFLSLFPLNIYHFQSASSTSFITSPQRQPFLPVSAGRESIPLSSICCSFLASLLLIYS